LVGQHISADGADVILLETVPENFARAARKLLEEVKSSLSDELKWALNTGRIRFADNLPAPSGVHVNGHGQAALIPAEWSLVFCDSYVRQVKKAAEEKRSIAEEDIHHALVVLLASLLGLASQFPAVSSGPVAN
jgi:hypothetical protein